MGKLNTKHEEIITTTSDISEMRGKYLAERLTRKWYEDFVDESNGEVVSIERNELIYERGKLLDAETLSAIKFFLDSGDIKEVAVSNQQRTSELATQRSISTWSVKLEINKKKAIVLLYANSVTSAMEIATDYIEQTTEGYYSFLEVKELAYTNLITNYSKKHEKEHAVAYYSMLFQVNSEDGVNTFDAVVKAVDAEEAKELAYVSIKQHREANGDFTDFSLTITTAKTVSCKAIIPFGFCMKYLEE